MQVMQKLYYIRFAKAPNSGTQVLSTKCGETFRFVLPAWNLFTQEYKTLGKMKVEPDLSLERGTFSVRYECWQSLEIDVSLFRFYYSAWFLHI